MQKILPLLSVGYPQDSLENETVLCRPFGAKRTPYGRLFIFPPTAHAGPVAVGRPRLSPPLAFATLRSVIRGYAAPSLSTVAYGNRGRNPAAGGLDAPPRLDPRLRFGHPARPP